MDGSDVNAVDRSPTGDILAIGDDFGNVRYGSGLGRDFSLSFYLTLSFFLSLSSSLSPSFSLSIPLLLHEPTKCFSSIKVFLCYQPQFLFFLSFFHSFFLTFESSAGFLLQISLSSTGCLSRFKIHRTF